MKEPGVNANMVVAVAIGLAVGYAIGATVVTLSYAPKIAKLNSMFPQPTDVRSLSGQVAGINGRTLTLKVDSVTSNPFGGNFPAVRVVTVTASTKIISAEPKDPAEFQKELQALAQQLTKDSISTSTASAAVAPVVPFTITDIAWSDIKVGDIVTVTADSNILSAPNFTATVVQKQVQPIAPSNAIPSHP